MSEAERKIRSVISQNGAISFSQFIRIVMYSEDSGYYMNRNPIGKDGDFITSPEITSLFGRTIAVWILGKLQAIENTKAITIVELGPGTGIMMHDILSSISRSLKCAFEVYMVEISPCLREVQERNLAKYLDKVHWVSSLSEVPEETNQLIIANEFFDALPIDQFVFMDGKFLENKISENPITHSLEIVSLPSDFSINGEFKNGDIIEVPVEGQIVAAEILRRFNDGASALIIDYGHHTAPKRSTVQAVKRHKFVSILDDIGNCDITHEVDFSLLFPDRALLTQGEFLTRYGIFDIAERFTMLGKGNIALTLERLISDKYMGGLFKCMVL